MSDRHANVVKNDQLNGHRSTVMIMAGGTGGHIFPALAVAQDLEARGYAIVWLGSEGAMETRLLPQYGIKLETLSIKGVRGNGLKRKLMLPLTLWKTILAARHILKQYQVGAVVGFGGFVTFPGGVAARLSRIPLIVHEQNAIAGLSNKVLSRWASRVLYAFPHVFPNERGLVGNPVRADIAAIEEPKERFEGRSGPLRVLVMGGSLGADVFNQVVPRAMALMPESARPVLTHQSGRNKLEALQKQYNVCGVKADCVEFITDMVSVYQDMDMVICRSGALTIAELTAVGLGAILVPFPHAVDDHQTANAKFMVDNQSAQLIPQTVFNAEKLATILSSLTRENCLDMANQARLLGISDGADRVATVVIETMNRHE